MKVKFIFFLYKLNNFIEIQEIYSHDGEQDDHQITIMRHERVSSV